MVVSLVAAMSRNRIIGRDGGLPWHLPADLRRFRALTAGHPVVMGRRTWEEVGRPLPHRFNIVMSRAELDLPDGVALVHDAESALTRAAETGTDLVSIAGGGIVYEQFLPRADRIELTVVEAEVEGDTVFPEFDEADWRLVARYQHPADDRHAHAMRFETWIRRVR